jgi:hypothetical protein
MESKQTEQRLREIAAQHHVYYKIWPEQVPLKDHSLQEVGFRLELHGEHAKESHPMPGCALCWEIYRGLREIAYWILPKEIRDSYYDLEAFDASLHYSHPTKDLGSVQLGIDILHRSGFDRPVDACEVRCLQEMEEKLKRLGVHRGSVVDMQRLPPSRRASGGRS